MALCIKKDCDGFAGTDVYCWGHNQMDRAEKAENKLKQAMELLDNACEYLRDEVCLCYSNGIEKCLWHQKYEKLKV